ncbi:hypothetical protein MKK65_10180 [Methylobacterium sp. J-001]|uniref:hypothetical protein n=1 Tax=Methylobacterium sp. J-001 TaxID=2836609 RepID=UPI001FB945F3|nr:hypothetical protein [Methylobacterium sp. J-001]MCJ2116931.1 hypothetical protein [Methylobacterium sp. J-001]
MPNVVPLPTAQTEPPETAHPALHRQGRCLARLLTFALGLTVLFAVAVLACSLLAGDAWLWLAPGAAFLGPPPADTPGLVPFDALPQATRWAYAATFILDTLPVILILAEGRIWAKDVGAGIAFSAAGPARIRRIAVSLTDYAVAPALGHGLVLLAGHGVDVAWFHASSLHALVLAACLTVLAEVARIGHAAACDLDGFV